MKDFNQITDERGKAAEYHVNNTLHRLLGAVRFRSLDENKAFYLFDGMVLPTSPGSDRLTEVDHLLVSTKGIFSIETKSIAGKVFGERKSKKWNSAQASRFGADGLYDRGFTNPFNQNMLHINAVRGVIGDQWINNVVVLVDADMEGWLPGKWGSDSIKDLFLSADELAENISGRDDVLTLEQVGHISDKLGSYYRRRNGMREAFFGQIKAG
ncbi:nuclease-related domain-containing protein [Hydrogenovibrio marinus]|uniref:NERD domain-containing protein n=1 Tax=Hydrogenovibrio marinus TaxID=28885 RepID=A0A066ZLG2_HYDMR|nr:nuclease-related domain-containing protein [Hydrogenovibrio marinus]KDN94648.1 hypothetical protein EI16_12165 [Hydrogenovibrio marinus]